MRLLIIVVFILAISSAFGIKSYSYNDNKVDSTIISNNKTDPSTIDSIYYSYYTNDDSMFVWGDLYSFSNDSIPSYQDSIYKLRIEYLDTKSPFSFEYNESVRRLIGFYATRRKGLIERSLVRKELYFPLFEKMLDKYQIPMELKYLSIVESALNPTAKSRVGAQGLWQFMPGTGRMYGLHRSSRVDDRMNMYKATEAACQHFCDLYDRYHDWNLVLAAYNAGPGNVNKAIRRAGGNTTNYWEIRRFLPRETQNYVPAFIAVSYLMEFPEAHNIQAKNIEGIHYYEIDTVYISKKLNFSNLSAWLNIDERIIEELNPQYRRNYIPARVVGTNKKYVLTLPSNKIGEFIINEDKILSGLTPKKWEIEASK
ncbi:MAG: lytic transglycosylase domain-containing protein [Bacteroidales bacterium]|nr:lytic transglycosylase domain-containing protein [Bacteroidales bacterium]